MIQEDIFDIALYNCHFTQLSLNRTLR